MLLLTTDSAHFSFNDSGVFQIFRFFLKSNLNHAEGGKKFGLLKLIRGFLHIKLGP